MIPTLSGAKPVKVTVCLAQILLLFWLVFVHSETPAADCNSGAERGAAGRL